MCVLLDFILVVFKNFSLLKFNRHSPNLVGILSPRHSILGEILFIKYGTFAMQVKIKNFQIMGKINLNP